MPNLIITAIFITGLSGITAQVLILRELLVSFYGNELTLGIILASWILAEGLGVLMIGKLIETIKDKLRLFIVLVILFCLSLPLAIYAARVFKIVLGFSIGEGLGLPMILSVALAINFIPAFIHGGLFSAASKIYSLGDKNPAGGISRVYAWETLGTACGGFMLTYFFLPHLSYFQIALVICLANFIAGAFLIEHLENKILKDWLLGLLIMLVSFFIVISPARIQKMSLKQQYRQAKVLSYQNSVYGNMVVTQAGKQRTFYYNGMPIVTSPYPDINFLQDFGNLPMLFHGSAKEVFLIGEGLGGLSYELLKHPLDNLYYAEIDPLVVDMLQTYPSKIINRELKDKRLHIIRSDGRYFLNRSSKQYDLILVGIPYPSDLTDNRYFSEEFFLLVSQRLKKDGVIALTLPGSLAYLSPQLRDLNACVYNAMALVFPYIRLIPGDDNLYLACASPGLINIGPELIMQRIKKQNLKTDILTPTYLNYRLDQGWMRRYENAAKGAVKKINRDFTPFGVFKTLDYWNEKFSPKLSVIFSFCQGITIQEVLFAVILITFLILMITKSQKNKSVAPIIYGIATTGFFGMLINLVLVFGFQVLYGYLYQRIGFLIGIFMSGIALGSMMIPAKQKGAKNVFIFFEFLIAAFSILVAKLLLFYGASLYAHPAIFTILFFCAGLLMGAEFSLASRLCLLDKNRCGEVAGKLYFADLLGGACAGILGGILFLPVLGIWFTCLTIVFLKVGSILILSLKNP